MVRETIYEDITGKWTTTRDKVLVGQKKVIFKIIQDFKSLTKEELLNHIRNRIDSVQPPKKLLDYHMSGVNGLLAMGYVKITHAKPQPRDEDEG